MIGPVPGRDPSRAWAGDGPLTLAAIEPGECTGAWASGAGAESGAGAHAYFFGMSAPAPAAAGVSDRAETRDNGEGPVNLLADGVAGVL
jgi:hypothetical protein